RALFPAEMAAQAVGHYIMAVFEERDARDVEPQRRATVSHVGGLVRVIQGAGRNETGLTQSAAGNGDALSLERGDKRGRGIRVDSRSRGSAEIVRRSKVVSAEAV